MPNLFSNLRECTGFSHMIISTFVKTSFALKPISSRLPIGVETIYNPLSILFISTIFIFLLSCAPVNNTSKKILLENIPENTLKKNEEKKQIKEETASTKATKKTISSIDQIILNNVEIILPKEKNKIITKNLINSFELSIYKKKINNLQLNINNYYDVADLNKILSSKAIPGKIFLGTLDSEATKTVKKHCNSGILFFSLASDRSLAGDCVYLINFFPEDDLRALFNYFPENSRIALLYPQNFYGYNINKIIDPIALNSNSIIINRASYLEDLTNARDAIKELSKFELRKYELERQKKILINKGDEESIKILNKIKKFETLGDVDFTHLLLPDYGIRLLEIAPLLPFYDVDPNKVQFVGTGVWDDSVFFDEPALQGSIFSGIEEKNRRKFFDDYQNIYKEKPIRTATIPFDLVGIISYIINNKMNIGEAYDFLDNSNFKFEGIDGEFFFNKNIITRKLGILKIKNGSAEKLN